METRDLDLMKKEKRKLHKLQVLDMFHDCRFASATRVFCVNIIHRSWRTWKWNQITPTYFVLYSFYSHVQVAITTWEYSFTWIIYIDMMQLGCLFTPAYYLWSKSYYNCFYSISSHIKKYFTYFALMIINNQNNVECW